MPVWKKYIRIIVTAQQIDVTVAARRHVTPMTCAIPTAPSAHDQSVNSSTWASTFARGPVANSREARLVG